MGVWQVERLHWKRELIATIEARLASPPIDAPSGAVWSPRQVYTRVTATGVFHHDQETLVQAVTVHGAGFWVVTPLETDEGVILVNRGFVPADRRSPASRPSGQMAGPVRIVGLLRASEPHGAFLRSNAPRDERWYSRDVAAIAAARRLEGPVAPYFVDADATPNPGGYPIGGLTVVRLRNSHLAYAMTWFALGALSAAGGVLVWRSRPG